MYLIATVYSWKEGEDVVMLTLKGMFPFWKHCHPVSCLMLSDQGQHEIGKGFLKTVTCYSTSEKTLFETQPDTGRNALARAEESPHPV